MYKIMIRDSMAPIAKKLLESAGQFDVIADNDKAANDPAVLAGIIGDYDGIAIRSGTKITEEVIKNAKKLKVIGRAGIGVDNIDVPAATRRGIIVMNAPGGNTVTTAEHTISMILSLSRNIPQATASLREGRWEKKKLTGVEISGKTLGIVGLGQIGRVVADRAKGLKMNVIASDPFVSKDAAKTMDIELVSFDDLLTRADFITLHVPRLRETANMINAETIRRMKRGVRIINCSRGEVVDIDALYQALESGHAAGAALDVFPKEPPDPETPILKHPNVIFTPHLGASTDEAQNNVAKMIAEQMIAYFHNGVIMHAVNFPSVSGEMLERLGPYLDIAEKMGSLMGQLVKKTHDVSVIYSGDVAALDTRPITHAVLKGLIGAFTDFPVNYVNAPEVAKERGIRVHETKTPSKDDFASLIRIKLEEHDDGPDEIWGTVFGKKYPRIVRIGQISVDAVPDGYMIVIQNNDKPGVIGNIGTTLGNNNINIGRFQLGRLGDRAMCLVNIDTPADDRVLEQILNLPHIISARQVRL